jgi:hypothetical protein
VILQAALDYAARGLPVFPVYPVIPFRGRFACKCLYGLRCERPGKHPMTRHGLGDATSDPVAIREFWACAPDANLGIACSAECCVIDVDPRHGGDDALADLERKYGPLPITWTVKTGGGGSHYFFRSPQDIRNSAGKIGVGLDIRGSGGYVVAPPSRHVSGNLYEWKPGHAPGEVPLAVMPAWLIPTKQSKGDAPVPAFVMASAGAERSHRGHAQRDHRQARGPLPAPIRRSRRHPRNDDHLERCSLQAAAHRSGGEEDRQQHRWARAEAQRRCQWIVKTTSSVWLR